MPDVPIFSIYPRTSICLWGTVGAATYAWLWRKAVAVAGENNKQRMEKTHTKQILYFQELLEKVLQDSLDDLLRELSVTLSFTMEERICIYRHLPEKKGFDCVGRFSSHPNYTSRSSERKIYSEEYGVFTRVWSDGQHNGKFRDENFPTSKNKYLKYLTNNYAIPREVAEKFRMNAKDIFAKIIRDSKGTSVAIILFESRRKQILNESLIESSYCDKEGMIIAALERLLKPINAPTLQSAKKEDY